MNLTISTLILSQGLQGEIGFPGDVGIQGDMVCFWSASFLFSVTAKWLCHLLVTELLLAIDCFLPLKGERGNPGDNGPTGQQGQQVRDT